MDQADKVFRIGDLSLTKLSGPISIKYLVPIKEVFLEKAAGGIFLPIIILLGDRHYSEDGRCDPCEEEKGCFLVESDSFLSTLNDIAERVPVDVYTEYAKDKKPLGGGVLFDKFYQKTQGCHKTELRSSRYQCQFPNVRWHYADPRFWQNTVEEEVSVVARYLKSLVRRDLSRTNMDTMSSMFFYQFMSNLIQDYRNDKTMRQFCKSLSTLMRKTLVDKGFGRKNLIHKQLKKYNLDMTIDFYCYSSMEFHGMVSDKKVREEINHEGLEHLYNYIFSGEGLVGSYIDLITKIGDLWVMYTACVLDMYFLGRMFKTPRDNINSYITVGFFGHEHTRAITDYLCSTQRWYNLDYFSDEPDRCVRVSKQVDVNKDLDMYTKWRLSHGIKIHIARLQAEQNNRNH